MPVDKSRCEGSIDPVAGLDAKMSPTKATKDGARSGPAGGVIFLAALAVLVIAGGGIFAVTHPVRLAIVPAALARSVPKIAARLPGSVSPVRVQVVASQIGR
jgi:hypothetical protein